MTRRHFLALIGAGIPVSTAVDAVAVEPGRLRIRRVKLNASPSIRLVHFSDVHYKGSRRYLERVVRRIDEIAPDAVCFTGDFIEDARFLTPLLDILAGIRHPVFATPGNHDHHSGASFAVIDRFCRKTGGAWLVDRRVRFAGTNLVLYGLSARKVRGEYVSVDTRALPWTKVSGSENARAVTASSPRVPRATPDASGSPGNQPLRVCLVHYPQVADWLSEDFDLILAGHSHGGQVRLPGIGPLVLPRRVGPYDMGLFRTKHGPLYVNPGIGTLWNFPVRFLCPPELTVIEI